MTPRRAAPFVLVFAAAAAGCGGDDVRSYHAPRAAAPSAREVTGKYRLLGAMVPADDPVWFFKLSGPADALAPHEAGFDALVASIKHKGEAAHPEFAVPPGWKLGGPRSGFVPVAETVKLPDGALEVTVVKSGGGVDQNLDRWVGMLGHKGGVGDRERFTKGVAAAGGKVLRVDIRGDKNPNAGGPMMGKTR